MDCPKCGAKWFVVNTASSGDLSRPHLIARGDLVRWYTHDYIVRTRVCKSCGKRSDTIELEITDVDKMLRITAKEGLPDKMLKPKGSNSDDVC